MKRAIMESKLTILKKRQFTPQGRERRIAASLAALKAPSPTKLTAAQWVEVAEGYDAEAD